MRILMSFQARRELLVTAAPRYKEAGRKLKSIILNEFVASTGYSRKYAIKLMSVPENPFKTKIKRPRLRVYGTVVQDALLTAWSASNYIASKRLSPFLAELVPILERHGHLQLTDPVRNQLTNISPATIDRILRPWRKRSGLRGLSLTRSGKLLKNQIPVRTFADWGDDQPGFFEADLVAHCGWSAAGSFLSTLVLTDIATGWVECLPLLHKSGQAVINAIDCAKQLLPFPILGLDTDNGSEFINSDLLSYCEKNKITFTRGRAYKKNDQCHVEQKNGAIVRQLIGYDRFEGQMAYRQLTELYRAVRLFINFFQPSMKLLKKERENSKIHKKYDRAKTPFRRLCATEVIEQKQVTRLNAISVALDPVRLIKQIEVLQNALWKLAIMPQNAPELNRTMDVQEFHSCSYASFPLPNEDSGNKLLLDHQTTKKRRYRDSRKLNESKKPRLWRTRFDPFVKVWDELLKLLECNPERTATSLFSELQEKYPGVYSDGQLRTLQRRVKVWRSETIIAFNDRWINDDSLSTSSFQNCLRAVFVEELDTEVCE